MATELTAIGLIREHTTVPVPTVHFSDCSRELCDADYFFMEFVEGENFGLAKDRMTPAERDQHNEALGAATRELNALKGPGFGPLAGPYTASWRTQFTSMVEDVLRDGERRAVDLGRDYAGVRKLFAEHADTFDEVTEPAFVEWDLWDSNVLIRDGRIACIIDHERAFYGDPLIEAGFTAFEMPEFGDSTAFQRGYGRPALSASEQVRRRLYTTYLALVMIIETRYRGHTDDAEYDFARARLDDLVALFGRTR
jgi:aminoglycoside phosphotransferase (APT) family kinase protein